MSCDRCHRWEPLAPDGCRKSNRLSPELALVLAVDWPWIFDQREFSQADTSLHISQQRLLSLLSALRRRLQWCPVWRRTAISASSSDVRSGVAMLLVTLQPEECTHPPAPAPALAPYLSAPTVSLRIAVNGEKRSKRAAREIDLVCSESLVVPVRRRVPPYRPLGGTAHNEISNWAVTLMAAWQLRLPWTHR